MKRAVYLLIATILLNTSMLAQSDKSVALTINGKTISKGELQKAYNANKESLDKNDNTTVNDFIEGYIFHALVLEEAHNRRLDTTRYYKQELASYDKQLISSLLKDTITEKQLATDILKNLGEELSVNQIFIPFDSTLIQPSDTVAPYKRALKARELAIKEGFDKVIPENKIFSYGVVMDIERETGELGWLKAYMFSYKLNTILYALKQGEVTMPIRSGKGYHILQVVGRRPLQGSPVLEQVMFNFPVIPADKKIEDSIYHVARATYEEIALKGNFQEICDEFAQAYDRGDDGCMLGTVNLGDPIPYSIIKASTELKNRGEVSKPILTPYGWHILRLKEIQKLPTQEELKASIKTLIATEKVYPELLERKRNRMFKENKASLYTKVYDKLYALTEQYNPKEDAFINATTNSDDVLISINGKVNYTVKDLLKHIKDNRWIFEQPDQPDPLVQASFSPMVKLTLSTDIFKALFEGFIYTVLTQYERDHIAEKVPRYTPIVNNLSEDLLFTKMMELEVWLKSSNDIEGLQEVYEKNSSKYTIEGNPFKGLIVYAKDEATIAEIEKEYAGKTPSANELRKKYNSKEVMIQVERGLWQKGDNQVVDNKLNNIPAKSTFRNFPYYTVIGKHLTQPEEVSDVKYQVQKDYQDELQSSLSTQLKEKYNVTINNAVIKTIK